MAITSVNGSSSSSLDSTAKLSGRVLDVQGLVDSVVASKMAPLNQVNAEIDRRDLAISAAGIFRSKVADVEASLSNLESLDSSSLTFNDLRDALQSFVESYNALRSYYTTTVKSSSAASTNQAESGALSGNSGVTGFMARIASLLGTGLFKDNALGSGPSLSLRSLGVVVQSDGSLLLASPLPLYNGTTKLSLSETRTELLSRFKSALDAGLTIGYEQSSTTKLRDFLSTNIPLVLTNLIADKQIQKVDFQTRRDILQSRLKAVRNSAIKQYSALDAQLVKMQSLNSSITSMLSNLSGK